MICVREVLSVLNERTVEREQQVATVIYVPVVLIDISDTHRLFWFPNEMRDPKPTPKYRINACADCIEPRTLQCVRGSQLTVLFVGDKWVGSSSFCRSFCIDLIGWRRFPGLILRARDTLLMNWGF